MAILKLKNDNTAWTINGDNYTTNTLRVYGNVIANNLANYLMWYDQASTALTECLNSWKRTQAASKSSITVSTANAWMSTGLTFSVKPGCLYGLYCSGVANRGFQVRNSSGQVHYTYYRSYSGGYTGGFAHLFYAVPDKPAWTGTVYVYPTATGTISNVYVYEIPVIGGRNPVA